MGFGLFDEVRTEPILQLHYCHHCIGFDNLLTLRYLLQELEEALRLTPVSTTPPERVSSSEVEPDNSSRIRSTVKVSEERKVPSEPPSPVSALSPVVQRKHVDDYFGESLNGMGFGLFDEVRTVHQCNIYNPRHQCNLYNPHHQCFVNNVMMPGDYLLQELEAALRLDVCTSREPESVSPLELANSANRSTPANSSLQKKASEITSAFPIFPVKRRHVDDYFGESLNGMGFGLFDEDVRTVHECIICNRPNHHCFIHNNVLTLKYLHQELEAALRLDVCTKEPESVSPMESANSVNSGCTPANSSPLKKASEIITTATMPMFPVQRRHVDDYFGESLNGMGFGLFDEVRTVHQCILYNRPHHHCFIRHNVLTLRYLHQELEAALRLDVCTKQPEPVSPLETANSIDRFIAKPSPQVKVQEATLSAIPTPEVVQRRQVDNYFGESLNGMGFGLFDEVRTVHHEQCILVSHHCLPYQ